MRITPHVQLAWAAYVNLSHARSPRAFLAHALLLLIVAVLAPTLGWTQQSLEDQALEQQGLTRPQSGWSGTVGAGLALTTKYPGASTERLRPAPLIAIDYDGRVSIGPFGVEVAAVRWHGLRAGPVLGFEGGRRASDDPRLTGLGDISSSITGGLFAAYTRGPLEVSATARQAITHSANGLSGLMQVNFRHVFLASRTFVAAGPDLEFGNGDFERAWFGISPAQATTSGLPVYVPRAGINRVGLHAELTHRVTQHLFLRFFARLSDITAQAAQSPIVERRTQVDVGAGIAYHF